MRVLVVDDRREDLYLLQKMLEKEGFEVVPAANGREALEAVKGSLPDLVLSDILMPEMDGYQLLRAFKSDKRLRNIPFVFYTATYTSKKDEELAYSLGASKFIIKPLEHEEFMKVLRGVLSDSAKGLLPVKKPSIKKEEPYLRRYNERLVQKLEEKLIELQRLKDFLHLLVDSMEDGVIFIDVKGEVKLANKKGLELEKAAVEKIAPLLKSPGAPCHCDFDLEAGGRYYDIRCSTVSTEEEYLGHTIVLRDVTERKKAEEKLKRHVEELERWQRLTVDREMRMIELKRRIKELEAELSRLRGGEG